MKNNNEYSASQIWLRFTKTLIKSILHREQFKSLERFRSYHSNKTRCFIAGNGPSLRRQDLTLLKDDVLFVTNGFVYHEQYEKIAPTYYCVSDTKFWNTGKANPEWYEESLRKTTCSIKFFPSSFAKIVQRDKLFPNEEVFYLNYSHLPVWLINNLSLDITRWVHTGDTVIIDFCIPLAYFMGFKEIYLIGCDTDYQIDRTNDLSNGFFYDHKKDKVGTTLSPDYIKTVWVQRVLASYAISKRALESRGVKIFNATDGGKLEIFPRVDFNTLF